MKMEIRFYGAQGVLIPELTDTVNNLIVCSCHLSQPFNLIDLNRLTYTEHISQIKVYLLEDWKNDVIDPEILLYEREFD